MRRVIRKLSRRGGFLASLVVALLAAQAIIVAHELDPAGHAPGQACETCLAASHLAGANVAAPALPATVEPPPAIDAGPVHRIVFHTPRRFRARAPPLAS